MYGDPAGHSAIARTVGLPCGIVIDGVLGVYALYTVDLFGRCWRGWGWGMLSGRFEMLPITYGLQEVF